MSHLKLERALERTADRRGLTGDRRAQFVKRTLERVKPADPKVERK